MNKIKQISWAGSLTGAYLIVMGVGLAHGAAWALAVAGILTMLFAEAYEKDFEDE
jgi:hypothetical protein